MIVVDASVVVGALLGIDAAAAVLRTEQLHAPHLIDVEVASALRRHVRSGAVSATAAWSSLGTWRAAGVERWAVTGLLDRIWSLRDALSSYDASYVALAEALGCGLTTGDARLARAPGVRCPVTTLPA